MAQNVRASVSQTRISSKHQVTIAKPAFEAAGFKAGDTLMVRALGPGRVELTRVEDLIAKHSGRIDGDGRIREAIEALRDEWD